MNFFTNKMGLQTTIKEQENEIQQLKGNLTEKIREMDDLKFQLTNVMKQNLEYEARYINTNRECDFCYCTLQQEYIFCPKCGKKIERVVAEQNLVTNSNQFQIEQDKSGVLITQYNGFSEKKIVIPSSIEGKKVIGVWNDVFLNCEELEEVYFEEGCQYIGANVFCGCERLKKVRLPKSLIEIGDMAFFNCVSIKEIAIPHNVTVIGTSAFAYCKELKKIYLPNKLQYISGSMLKDSGIEEIDIPQSVKHIGASAFENTMLKMLELPCNLYSIENNAFDTSSLEKLVVHSNVQVIGRYIFGMREVKTMLYCAAGSKAHLYARKHNIKCNEISSQLQTESQTCVHGILLEMESAGNVDVLKRLYLDLGVNKAETWSWKISKVTKWTRLEINKAMTMNEAVQLKDKIESFVRNYTSGLNGNELGTLKELCIFETWGYSDV